MEIFVKPGKLKTKIKLTLNIKICQIINMKEKKLLDHLSNSVEEL